MLEPSWQTKAAAKRADTLAKIPPHWRLSAADLERAAGQRDITGPFIQQFLDHDEVAIVSMDSVPIVNAIQAGRLSASQVVSAFCKTAAIAHQIVSPEGRLPAQWRRSLETVSRWQRAAPG